jgi:ERCC4-type nuclease
MAYEVKRPHPSKIVAAVDTREQQPLNLQRWGIAVVVKYLYFGDYSVLAPDMLTRAAFETKTLPDFVACVGKERDRFEREIQALRGYQFKAIVCKFTLGEVLRGEYRSKIHVASVVGSIARWMAEGIPFIMAESHEGASFIVAELIKLIAVDEMNKAMAACSYLFEEDIARRFPPAEIEEIKAQI